MRRTVAVIGGGYGGSAVAKALESEAGVILVDPREAQVTVVDPAERLLPAFQPELRQDLHRQLDELDIRLRLGTGLTAPPATEPGQAAPSPSPPPAATTSPPTSGSAPTACASTATTSPTAG
ncbi:NAD-binding protein [Nonomuraea sp. 3-1Str]|uniref:NAD-binding protein n=1 Tax=Nonomuraea sp. 3-1Str TaxID=2929801 RepID=UPI0028705F57|nr:NAD-binding protein [Nonomuraea sp. 3-1Str]